jgi:hypothetical protein
VGLERKVACVEQLHLCVPVVALERFRTARKKKRIVLAPDGQQRWLLGAEVILEFGIQRHVAGVVQEKVELDLVVAGPGQERGIERGRLWRDLRLNTIGGGTSEIMKEIIAKEDKL